MNIVEVEDFLPKQVCEDIIESFDINNVNTLWRDTKVIDIFWQANDISKGLMADIITTVRNKFDNNLMCNYSQIVFWPTNSSQEAHYDDDYHPATSILYLNDNYEGGETFIGDKVIKPKQGKMIIFNGDKILHGVNKVTKGERYTIPAWYKFWSLNEYNRR